jgi:hypothetical protein
LPGLVAWLSLMVWAGTLAPLEARQVRKEIATEGLEGFLLEIPAGTVRAQPTPYQKVLIVLELECVGELIACGKAERALDLAVVVEDSRARVSLAGVAGLKDRLQGGESSRQAGPGQIRGDYDEQSRRWSESKEWSWKKPKSGDWALKVFVTLLVPAKLPLEIRAETADVKVLRALGPTTIEVDEGLAFAAVSQAETSTARLEVKRGDMRVVDERGRKLEVQSGRKFIEWRGDGDQVSVVLKVNRGVAQVRVLDGARVLAPPPPPPE